MNKWQVCAVSGPKRAIWTLSSLPTKHISGSTVTVYYEVDKKSDLAFWWHEIKRLWVSKERKSEFIANAVYHLLLSETCQSCLTSNFSEFYYACFSHCTCSSSQIKSQTLEKNIYIFWIRVDVVAWNNACHWFCRLTFKHWLSKQTIMAKTHITWVSNDVLGYSKPHNTHVRTHTISMLYYYVYLCQYFVLHFEQIFHWACQNACFYCFLHKKYMQCYFQISQNYIS